MFILIIPPFYVCTHTRNLNHVLVLILLLLILILPPTNCIFFDAARSYFCSQLAVESNILLSVCNSHTKRRVENSKLSPSLKVPFLITGQTPSEGISIKCEGDSIGVFIGFSRNIFSLSSKNTEGFKRSLSCPM